MKRDYLSSLARAARWYLPPAEAAEVLEDYQEIAEGRSEEELRRDLGTPRTVARQLTQPKEYQRWLAVFAILTVSIMLPGIAPIWHELSWDMIVLFRVYWFWDIGERVTHLAIPFTWVFFAVGIALSLFWFRRNGKKGAGGTLFRRVLPRLALILAGMAWIWFIAWLVLGERWELMNSLFSTEGQVSAVHLSMGVDAFAMGLIGLFGLIRARLGDRRWLAVYVLGLAGVILNFSLWALLTSLNFNGFIPGWQIPFVVRYAFITLAGLAGTGAALC